MQSRHPMEQSWTFESWKPSVHPGVTRFVKPSKQKFERDLLPELQMRVTKLVDLPYDPTLWRHRAESLLSLGYPELAASDAYKAIMLYDAAIECDSNCTALGDTVWLQYGMKMWNRDLNAPCWGSTTGKKAARNLVLRGLVHERLETYNNVLLEALFKLRALADAKRMCRHALKKYPRTKDLLDWEEILEEEYNAMEKALRADRGMGPKQVTMMQMGSILVVPYPWVPAQFASRSAPLIEQADKQMEEVSHGILEIRKSTLSPRNSTSQKSCLGVFAKRDIKPGEKILDSRTPFGVSSQQMRDQCYNCHAPLSKTITSFSCCPKLKFCSQECRDVADKYYHESLCGKDFEDLYRTMRQSDFETTDAPVFVALVWLRILAVLVKARRHPLKNPFFARLEPQYGFQLPQGWSLESHVVAPIHILQKLGIDVFSAWDYDAWVLETLWHRKKNNSVGESGKLVTFELDSMYSFLNHSCEVPPMIRPDGGNSSRKQLYATRAIKKGEEVCTTYVMGFAPKAARQQQLEPWLAGPCACRRCLSER